VRQKQGNSKPEIGSVQYKRKH